MANVSLGCEEFACGIYDIQFHPHYENLLRYMKRSIMQTKHKIQSVSQWTNWYLQHATDQSGRGENGTLWQRLLRRSEQRIPIYVSIAVELLTLRRR